MSVPNRYPVLRMYLNALLIFFFLRLAFLIYHHAFFSQTPVLDIVRAFMNGLLIDSSVAAVSLFLIRILTLVVQVASRAVAGRLYVILVYVVFGVYFFIGWADIPYFEIFQSRMNILVIDNLGQMTPIVGSILRDAPVYIATILWALTMVAFVGLNRRRHFITRYKWGERYSKTATGLSLVTLAGLSFLWIGEPFWRIGSFSSANQALGQLGLNGVYTLAKAIDQKRINEKDSDGVDYQFGNLDSALTATRAVVLGEDEEFVSDLYPMARRIRKPVPLAISKPNIVIVLMEGFSASYVGTLNPDGKGCSPGFDSLSRGGLLFTNFYGQETRTHHGLVSTIGSFPSLLRFFITRRRGTESFYTLGTLLKNCGYKTDFIYGYDQGFDHMGVFLKQGGIDRITDGADFPSPRFRGQWGVSDEDLFERANEVFAQCDSTTPFFSILLTSSNHAPFEVPGYFLEQHQEYAGSKEKAAFAYADYALTQFIEKARKEKYFRNTIFAFVSDHGEIRDSLDRSFKRFQIPCLIYAPNLITTPRRIATVGGQIDLATTLIHLIGYPGNFHFFGRDLLAIPENQGFAMMRSNNNLYYRIGDTVLVRDIRDTLSSLHLVDSAGRLQSAELNTDPDRKTRMNLDLESYLQTLYYVFSEGKHRCVDSLGN